jgi:hypothetical protein
MIFDHIFDLIGAEHRDNDAACRSSQFGDRSNRLTSDLGQPRTPGRIDIETNHWNICIKKATGIDLAHQTETDDGDGSAHRETPTGLCMRKVPI